MPLQRRLFVQRGGHGAQNKVASTNAAQNLPAKRGATRTVPPESLREKNEIRCCTERLRIVTAFLEEDPPEEDSSQKDADEGTEGKDANASAWPPNSARLNQRRSQGSIAGPALSTVMPGGGSASLPPITLPGRKPTLDSANQAYGQQRRVRPVGHIMASCQRSPRTQVSEEDRQSRECSDRIMQALCKEAYQGVKHVERQVFLGDAKFGSTPQTANNAATLPSGVRTQSGSGVLDVDGFGTEDALESAPEAGGDGDLLKE